MGTINLDDQQVWETSGGSEENLSMRSYTLRSLGSLVSPVPEHGNTGPGSQEHDATLHKDDKLLSGTFSSTWNSSTDQSEKSFDEEDTAQVKNPQNENGSKIVLNASPL